MYSLRQTDDVFPVAYAVATGAGLAILQLTWYYVANAAEVADPVRSRLKTLILLTGIAVFMLQTAKVAMYSGDRWIRRVSLTVTCMMSLAWILTIAVLFLTRGRLGGNSALISEPSAVRLLGGVIALAIYVLLALGPALLVSFVIRRMGRRQMRGVPPTRPHATS